MSSENLWIKICGNTSLEDAQLAADSGADAVGFIFAPSPRRVTPAQLAAIVPQLPTTLEKIGVFVDTPFTEIEATVQTCGLTGVQLHFAAPPELPARLRAHFGPTLRILRVIHFDPITIDASTSVMQDPNIDAVLVDSRTTSAVGGTGTSFDWITAGKTLFKSTNSRERQMIAAGGLTPQNIIEAIATLRPWGVDAVSGVESSPGRKDPAKVRAFISNARTAK